jgi:hypothetical protein
MIFDKVHLLFLIRIRIRIRNLKFRIRILQKVSDPYGSGSTTLLRVSWILTCTWNSTGIFVLETFAKNYFWYFSVKNYEKHICKCKRLIFSNKYYGLFQKNIQVSWNVNFSYNLLQKTCIFILFITIHFAKWKHFGLETPYYIKIHSVFLSKRRYEKS